MVGRGMPRGYPAAVIAPTNARIRDEVECWFCNSASEQFPLRWTIRNGGFTDTKTG